MNAVLMFAAVALGACGTDEWLVDAHVLVDGYYESNMDCRTGPCGHHENTDLIVYDGATYLVHRTALSQVLGPNSSLRVYRSEDHGATFTLLSIIPAPVDRDLRDPSFYVIDGRLAIKAITRLPVNSLRDSDVDSISVVTVSPDAGATWSPLAPVAPSTWSFWRVRESADGVYYSAAYEDGDRSVVLFSSVDGLTWTRGAQIYGVAEDTPLETELVFTPTGTMLALVRVDGTDEELLGSHGRLRTKVCTSSPPYAAFECAYELDGARLDGPVAFWHRDRLFVVAREHYLGDDNRKRTALYEIHSSTDIGPYSYTLHGEFPSTGDTAYAGVVPIDDNRYLVTYYSTNIHQDSPWARAVFGPTDVWAATIDLSNL